MKYHIDWHHPSGQVQALPRPQVCHVGLQTSEALQVGGSFQTVTSLNALNNHSNNLPFLSFTFTTPVSRHSFLAQYDIYNVATGRSASWNLEGKDSIRSHVFFTKKESEWRGDVIIRVQADQAPARPGWVDQAIGWPRSPSPTQRTGDSALTSILFRNLTLSFLIGSPSTTCRVCHVGTKRSLNRLRVWGEHLLQVSIVVFIGRPPKTLFRRETPESLDVMVTQTGRPGVVFNGVADWVYEEEVEKLLWDKFEGKSSGVVRYSSHLVFTGRRQDCLDPVQRHWCEH